MHGAAKGCSKKKGKGKKKELKEAKEKGAKASTLFLGSLTFQKSEESRKVNKRKEKLRLSVGHLGSALLPSIRLHQSIFVYVSHVVIVESFCPYRGDSHRWRRKGSMKRRERRVAPRRPLSALSEGGFVQGRPLVFFS